MSVPHRRIGSWVFCAFAALAAHGQPWQTVDKSILIARKASSDALYAGMVDFAMNIEFVSYRSANEVVPFERVKAVMHRSGDRFRSVIGAMTTIQAADIRLIIDRDDRSIMVANPVDLEDASIAGATQIILEALASCNTRTVSEGIEFKMVFGKNAVYDHQVLLFDQQGWLRRSETIWRQAIPENPNDALSPSHRPRLVTTYDRPTPIRKPVPDGLFDPWGCVRQDPGGLVAIGEWTGYEVIDTRYTP